MTIKGSLYLSIPMLKRFSAAKKLSSQNGSPKWRFFGNLRVYIKYSYRDPQKALPYPERRVPTYFNCVKIHLGVYRLYIAYWRTQKTKEKLVTPKARQNHVSGEQKPLNRSIQNFACRVKSMHDVITHANFWEDRLRGFGVAKGRILAFFIDLHRRL